MASSASSSSTRPVEETPEQLLSRFGDPSKALNHAYKHFLLPLESKCIEGMTTPGIEQALLGKELRTAYGELHYTLLKQHAFIAKMCQLPGLRGKDAFTKTELQVRMWGHGIRDFVSKLDSSNQETNQFIQSYLDRCKSLMEELKGDAPDLKWAWNVIEEQINLIRPATSD